MKKNLLILPAFNEETYLPEVLKSLRQVEEIDILVVDDGSTDETPRILKEAKIDSLIRHETNQGYGKSLIDGFEFGRKNGYTNLVTMDCDAQHEPEYIPAILKELKDFDIVSGSRYLPGSDHISRPPEDRVEINRAVTKLLIEHTGYSITDSFCGFKGYRVQALKKLRLTECGYGLPLQLWIQAKRAGLSVEEIPVPLIYKDEGRDFKRTFESKEDRLRYYLQVMEKEMKNG
ncbi:glycosyltransferase family 2 protein [bacterium]|nr:glycosyltransferase family 2 protein [bacterium]